MFSHKWDAFEDFFMDMGLRPSADHSLDRIDTNGNYEPGNCRWATMTQQANNKRGNVSVAVNGTQIALAEYLGSSQTAQYNRVVARLRNGWPMADAIFQPCRIERSNAKMA